MLEPLWQKAIDWLSYLEYYVLFLALSSLELIKLIKSVSLCWDPENQLIWKTYLQTFSAVTHILESDDYIAYIWDSF